MIEPVIVALGVTMHILAYHGIYYLLYGGQTSVALRAEQQLHSQGRCNRNAFLFRQCVQRVDYMRCDNKSSFHDSVKLRG